METKRILVAALAALVGMLITACGGARLHPDAALPATPAGGLPLPGAGVREGSVVDNDSAMGTAHYATQFASDTLVSTMLHSVGAGPAKAAYALYQIAARPADTPHMLSVNAVLTDQDPLAADPAEVYWLAYGDFSGGGDGVWRFAGPFTVQQARVAFPAGVDVVNGSGMIFAAVLALDSNKVEVRSVQIGYDLGPGYETYRMAQPRGSGVGLLPQVAIDSAGQPQIAYLESPSGLLGTLDPKLKIARYDGSAWVVEQVKAEPIASKFAFACGADGRRALVVQDKATAALQLLYDEGTGSFSTVSVIDASGDVQAVPDVCFINSLDDPLGALDTVLAVYGDNVVYPNCDVKYYVHYGGVNPPAMGNVSLATLRPDRLELMVEGNQATLGLLQNAAVPPGYDCHFVQYASVVNAWGPSAVPTLLNAEISATGDDFGLQLEALGAGQYVAGYLAENTRAAVFHKYDAFSWAVLPTDRVSCSSGKPWFKYAVLGDGSQVFPANYGAVNLSIYHGTVGSGGAFDFQTLSSGGFTATGYSIAASGTTAHIACTNLAGSALDYYRVELDGTVLHQTVDQGVDSLSRSLGAAQTVTADGSIHVFYSDMAHLRIVHSENRAGTWVREAEPILPGSGEVYTVLGAGYLETSGKLWVAATNLINYGIDLLVGTPDGHGGWNWVQQGFVSNAVELIGVFNDDGTNVGGVYIVLSPYSNYSIRFAYGPPGGAVHTETICADLDVIDLPWRLGYNPVHGTWDVAAADDEREHCLIHHRDSAGNWTGPYVACTASNAGDTVIPAGVTYAADTGRMRLTVLEAESLTGLRNVKVLGQAGDGWVFSTPILVRSIDSALENTGGVFVTADAAGFPVIAVAHKLLAAPEYDIEFFKYDGLGNWLSDYLWHSPFQLLDTDYYYQQGIALQADGSYVFAANNTPSSTEPGFGIVYLLYRW